MNPGTTALVRGLEVLDRLGDPHVGSARPRCGATRGARRRRQEPALAHAPDASRTWLRRARPRDARVPPRMARVRPGRKRRDAGSWMPLDRFSGSSSWCSARAFTSPSARARWSSRILSESPPSTLHAPGRVGGLTPLGTTSAGRVLVADLAPDELDALRPLRGKARRSRSSQPRDSRSCERSSSRGSLLRSSDSGPVRCDRCRAQCVRSPLPLRRSARRGGGAPGRGSGRAVDGDRWACRAAGLID